MGLYALHCDVGSIEIHGVERYRRLTVREWLVYASSLNILTLSDALRLGLDVTPVDLKLEKFDYLGSVQNISGMVRGITSSIVLDYYFMTLSFSSDILALTFVSTDEDLYTDFRVNIMRSGLYNLQCKFDCGYIDCCVTIEPALVLAEINSNDFALRVSVGYYQGLRSIFADALKRLIRSKRLSRDAVRRYFGVSDSEFTRLLLGDFVPSDYLLLGFCMKYKVKPETQEQLGVYAADAQLLLRVVSLVGKLLPVTRMLVCVLMDVLLLLVHSGLEFDAEINRVTNKYGLTDIQERYLIKTLTRRENIDACD